MSTVDNWMILSGVPIDCEGNEFEGALPACVIDLNRRIAEHHGTSPELGFVRVDHHALRGSQKAVEADVFLYAESRGLSVGEMLGLITQVDWGSETEVQVLYNGQDDHSWGQILRIVPGKWLESPPPPPVGTPTN